MITLSILVREFYGTRLGWILFESFIQICASSIFNQKKVTAVLAYRTFEAAKIMTGQMNGNKEMP